MTHEEDRKEKRKKKERVNGVFGHGVIERDEKVGLTKKAIN